MNRVDVSAEVAFKSYRMTRERFVHMACEAWDEGGEGLFAEWVVEWVLDKWDEEALLN